MHRGLAGPEHRDGNILAHLPHAGIVCIVKTAPPTKSRTYAPLEIPGPKTGKLRRYARSCCLPRLTWRPCHSGDVSAPRRPGVGERRFAAASNGAEERAPTPTARRHGTGFLGCSSRFVARVGEPPAHRPRGHRGPLASRPIPTVLGKDLAAPPSRSREVKILMRLPDGRNLATRQAVRCKLLTH